MLRSGVFFISVISSLSVFLLHCSDCDFRTQIADQMAYHLLMNPEHYSATCRTRSKSSSHTSTRGSTTDDPERQMDRVIRNTRLAECKSEFVDSCRNTRDGFC